MAKLAIRVPVLPRIPVRPNIARFSRILSEIFTRSGFSRRSSALLPVELMGTHARDLRCDPQAVRSRFLLPKGTSSAVCGRNLAD